MRNANVVILTDETEFARLLTACWQAERQAPNITVLNSDSWREQEAPAHDLVVVGPVRDGKITSVLRSLEPANAVILCVPADSREFGQLRTKYPRLLHIPLREDWAQTLLLVAGESLRRAKALQIATINAARVLKQEAELGSIAPGKRADLLLVEGNPSEHISDIRRCRMVLKNGTVYDSTAVYAAAGIKPAD